MDNKLKKVIYTRSSTRGLDFIIPVGAEGKILIYCDHPVTTKLLVDFGSYGKAIVPLSSVREI
ncbi:MAG: hypothetical protein V2B14_06230 [bacterium]